MPSVKAHMLQVPELEEEYRVLNEGVDQAVKQIQVHPRILATRLAASLRLTGFATALGLPASTVRSHLLLARDLHVGTFARGATEPGQFVAVTVAGQEFTVPGGLEEETSAPTWLNGFGLCSAFRDDAGLATLAAFDQRRFRSTGNSDPFFPAFTAALRAWQLREDPHALLDEADRLATQATIAPDYARLVGRPVIALARAVVDKDAAVLDERVINALTGYATLYRPKKHSWRADRLLPVLHIGLCAIAHDAGMTTSVTSAYLPPWLVTGGTPE
jgi:hypothetical protein